MERRSFAGAIGWLAREDKIIFNAPHDGKLANLRLDVESLYWIKIS